MDIAKLANSGDRIQRDILDLDTWTETRGTAMRRPDGSHRVEQEDGTAFTLSPSGRR